MSCNNYVTGRCSLAICDIVAVHPVHRGVICCSEVVNSPEQNLSSPVSPISPQSPLSPIGSNSPNERRKASEGMSPCHLAFTIHFAEAASKNRWRHRLVTLKHTDPRQVASWIKTLRNLIKGIFNMVITQKQKGINTKTHTKILFNFIIILPYIPHGFTSKFSTIIECVVCNM